MKRTPLTRRKRVNPVSKKTRTQRWPELKALSEGVRLRAGNRCEYCRSTTPPLDVHHVVARSHMHDDTLDNGVLLCRAHHQQTTIAFNKGRLVIVPLGGGQFVFSVVTAPDKWAARG